MGSSLANCESCGSKNSTKENHLNKIIEIAINDKYPYEHFINVRNILIRYIETKEKLIKKKY